MENTRSQGGPAAKQPAPVSTECTGAETLGMPELHHRCAGNTVVRVPGVTTPALTYTCGCPCHAPGDAS